MAAPLLTRKSIVLIKNEVTYGTDSTPVVGSNALLTTVPSISNDIQVLERNVTIGTLSPTQPVTGRKLVNVSFQTELKSQDEALDGVDSAPIQLDAFLRMCGMDPTYTVETSPPTSNDGYVTYAPLSDEIESATVHVYVGAAVLHELLGSFGDMSMDFVAGQYPMINASIRGLYSGPTDTTAATPTYETDIPVQSESLALVFGAVSGLVCRSFSIALNNEIVERPDVNSAEGLKGVRISGRRPTASFRIEKELVATWGVYASMDSGTPYLVSFTHGSIAGQKILVTIPKFSITNITESEDAGIAMYDIEGVCARNSDAGNDELTVRFF